MFMSLAPFNALGSDAKAVLNLFEQMRQQYPLQSDPEDLQDVLWCLSLLSSKYSCNKVSTLSVALCVSLL